MITYINGSPKINNSASNSFLNDVKTEQDNIYYVYKDNYDKIIDNIIKTNTIVMSFPLYADSPTSGILNFFEYINDKQIDLNNKDLYAIINCGFYESKQNNVAFDIVKCFCKNNGINFKGGLSIGAGPTIGLRNNKLYKILTKSYENKVNKLKEAINNNCYIELNTTISIPRRLYVYAANISWKKTIRNANKK